MPYMPYNLGWNSDIYYWSWAGGWNTRSELCQDLHAHCSCCQTVSSKEKQTLLNVSVWCSGLNGLLFESLQVDKALGSCSALSICHYATSTTHVSKPCSWLIETLPLYFPHCILFLQWDHLSYTDKVHIFGLTEWWSGEGCGIPLESSPMPL